MSDPTPVAAAEQEVLITRIFDAPREAVFRAWTDPDEVAAWFGPAHMSTPREGVRIEGAESVGISFPDFFAMLESIAIR